VYHHIAPVFSAVSSGFHSFRFSFSYPDSTRSETGNHHSGRGLQMQLIIVTGLPGAGKSSIAEAIGNRLSIPVFAKDWLEATLLRCGYPATHSEMPALGYIGYELVTSLLQRQLQLGQSAIADTVASTETIRSEWRKLAATYQAHWLVIECICSDTTLHRARLVARHRHIPGWPEVGWAEVERVAAYYAPWKEDCLILDSVQELQDNIAVAVEYVTHNQGATR
jgi:predicted kinase